MRRRSALLLCLAAAGLVTLVALEPRLHYSFPSMIDDWVAILEAPGQLRDVLLLGNPEVNRYRPGYTIWSALQWHTLGAPDSFLAPLLWGVLRAALLVTGVTVLAAVLVAPRALPGRRLDPRWLLVAGVPIAALTAPSLAVDVARYGPQEPLLVGCMALGAALLVRTFDELLEPDRPRPWILVATAAGLLLWVFGVLQKESSVCVLLLAPFLWPTLRAERQRWWGLGGGRRRLLAALGAVVLFPVGLMVVRLLELSSSDERLYGEIAAAKSFQARLWDQLTRAPEVLHTPLPSLIVVAAVVLLAVGSRRAGPDWLAFGLLLVAFGFVAFAAETGVVTSRYYLPAIVLAALALARASAELGSRTTLAAGTALVIFGTLQAVDARGWVEDWVDVERSREALVREAAARTAGGCEVGVTGLNVELVRALPVLAPLADEPPRGCRPGERYLVVIDPGGPGTETPPDDPVLSACAPEPQPVYASEVGKLLRCTA